MRSVDRRSELARTVGRNTLSLSGYDVIQHLSRTRRLDTYEVWSRERACSCVVKMLRPDRLGDERARAALLAEGRLLTTLAHPHIVRGYELIEEPVTAVVMETLDGETLAHLIARHPEGLYAQELAWLGLQVASALRYLHRRGILHLDVKPANVVAEAGRAKLIDLSLARPPGRYRPGLGTWCNLAPEQARGDELGPPADVWGLGTVLYEAATARAPFDEDDDGSWTDDTGPSHTWQTDDQLEAGYPQLEAAAPPITGLQDDLAVTIAACLAPDPADRPTLTELAALLAPFAPGARPWDA
jgi:eukaryotic-like serine/threonine-protein kinase